MLLPLTEHEAFDLVASRGVDKSRVDVVGVYCPDTRRCYYINPRRHGNVVQLRLQPTRNGQSKRVLMAERFIEFPETP